MFSMNTDGSGFQELLSFGGQFGAFPFGSLTLSGSTLYGMTSAGNIFSIDTDGSGFQNLFLFASQGNG